MHVYTYTPNTMYIYLKLGLTILGWISTPKLSVFSAIFAHWAVKDSSILKYYLSKTLCYLVNVVPYQTIKLII